MPIKESTKKAILEELRIACNNPALEWGDISSPGIDTSDTVGVFDDENEVS